jgi:type I restriction enzyme R subunit
MTPAGSETAPEARARLEIDRQLEAAGWLLQHRDDMNLGAASAIPVREFKLARGHGFVDYMLFVDGRAIGVCEAKPAGFPVRSVEVQARKYAEGVPHQQGVHLQAETYDAGRPRRVR